MVLPLLLSTASLAAPPGKPTQARAEKGRPLHEHGARGFCELLMDVQRFDLKLFGNQ